MQILIADDNEIAIEVLARRWRPRGMSSSPPPMVARR